MEAFEFTSDVRCSTLGSGLRAIHLLSLQDRVVSGGLVGDTVVATCRRASRILWVCLSSPLDPIHGFDRVIYAPSTE